MRANFGRDLSIGQGLEEAVYLHVKSLYPSAVLMEGSFKYFDIEVPEKFTIECKYDLKSRETGNIAIEFEDAGKPSGITTTQATYWVIQFWDYDDWKYLVIPVSVLRSLCKYGRIVRGGDNGEARMYLLSRNIFGNRYVRESF